MLICDFVTKEGESVDGRIRETLKILYQKANKNDFRSVVADIGVSYAEQRHLCDLLEQEGWITAVELLGKSSVRCDLTAKAIEYCKNEHFEEQTK